MHRERQTSSMTIFGYKGVKRENGAGSAEKQQHKASCVPLGRVKVTTDIVRLRAVTQAKPSSRNFPDMGVNRGQKLKNQGCCMENMRFKVKITQV